MANWVSWAFASLLLSLRLAPAFAFAPPFSLTQTPPLVRALLGLGLSAAIAGADPAARLDDDSLAFLAIAGIRELALGLVFVLALQLMFAGLDVAGRALDIQAGFGLGAVIDPVTGSQTPLIGSVLLYAGAAIFFALGGATDLVRIIAASLEAAPLGTWALPATIAPLLGFISALFALALAVAGGAMLCLFVADLAIGLVSRTVPQMNVLILGLQVKSLLVLLVLPATLGASAALLVRLSSFTLEEIPRLIR